MAQGNGKGKPRKKTNNYGKRPVVAGGDSGPARGRAGRGRAELASGVNPGDQE